MDTFAFIMLAIVGIILGPLIFIWCLNALVPVLAIGYTLKTWFAGLLLTALFFR